jgi:hypothetical protein
MQEFMLVPLGAPTFREGPLWRRGFPCAQEAD